MMNLYGVLKFVHVLSVVLWVGGVAALWITTLRIARGRDYSTVARLLPVGMTYGQRVVGPTSGLVLITGVWMAIANHLWSQPFVGVGIIGILLHFILGATVVRKSWTRMGELVSAPTRDDAALAAIVGRVTTVTWVYLAIMIIVIAVMVLKP
ncbi:MAG TPA: DUF2269 family protein [Gemmatimonadaceae bacterium]|nr:DUF2269 family protein [Gemmatimonadaceae bacterium]